MTVNESIFLLLRESLFGIQTNASEVIDDKEFWNKVYRELQAQTVTGLTTVVVRKHNEIPADLQRVWSDTQRTRVVNYVQMAAVQDEACTLLQKSGIDVAVIKGMAAAIYYPIPEHRTMGDVDLLVRPEDYKAAIQVLKENGFALKGVEEGRYHTAFIRYNVLFELHRAPSGTHIYERGDIIRDYILSGMDSIEENQIGRYRFPILPWKQNGMELIWHIRQHLYNGLGLRHIVDWMMFANYYLNDENMREYMPDLQKCGLDRLAIVVTKMCQRYLGLRCDNITWCESVDEDICEDLMNFIMEQGNFGKKVLNEKTAKVISGYNNPKLIFRRLQELGKKDWGILKKYPVLSPIAFIYEGGKVFFSLFKGKGAVRQFLKDVQLGRRRTRMFTRLDTENKCRNVGQRDIIYRQWRRIHEFIIAIMRFIFGI